MNHLIPSSIGRRMTCLFFCWALGLAVAQTAAADKASSPWRACVVQWTESRGVELSQDIHQQMVEFLDILETKADAEIPPLRRCDLTQVVLDQLLSLATPSGGTLPMPQLLELKLTMLRRELVHPDYSEGDALTRIIDQVRHGGKGDGFLDILVKGPRLHILINGENVGPGPWSFFLPSGTYSVTFSRGGLKQSDLSQEIHLEDRARVRLRVIERNNAYEVRVDQQAGGP